ncbi:AAA family ATPase [Nostocaceae cyanobacterium CENA369]|uniref:histidine kinase n=1 Tax=Dendronalium phyllosphericum CENA369 TaxID=1725256 RepID=A0A8J7I3I2_9NOST|nr:ATP-binding sensor histidine kinase [Dendronalium phyllosphericum]MBH8573970.1 AAA family ATPase [Dendronalium phyllosphericum CENA369]
MSNTPIIVNIPGYRIIEELYNGSRTLVYRGYREIDDKPVTIKLLKNPYPSLCELVQFRNQYTIAKNLNSPLILQIYSLEPYQNGYALVMEDFGGISLKEYFTSVEQRQITSLQEFLAIAIALCNALDILYRERIIHKDIKPSNILINPQTKQVKLIDFSIASLLPRETQTLVNPNVLEGTLAYISPEQTGRMNRGIDYRTDFYSLGVTFYELLTGELPFASNDPMELVHSHIAKLPKQLRSKTKKEIPQMLSDIVIKLMAKNAEDRYQSALGLKFDLEKCLHQLQVSGKVEGFEIAQQDVCDRFIIPDKLYGRDMEVQTLLQAFDRVSNGATEIMLVAGFSGIGKTAVINEVHKPIVRQRGYFIKGKFDQFGRNIPFSAFVQAFRDLMEQLLTESDVQLEQWKNNILEAVGENGQVIIEVIPELSIIIGEQPPAVELSGTAAQNRFNLLFQNFTKVFTSAEHPLVIFLDDLQWADSASLKLMQLLMADTGHLFIIGAYRDNETALATLREAAEASTSRETRPTQCLVQPAHPLMLTLSEIQKNQATINTIILESLSQVQVNKLVADTLKCPEDLALNLSTLLYQKTQGNPFFVTQFFKALHQDGLIKFDVELSCWQCDIAKVARQAVTDDVVNFMSFQLRKLPSSTQDILTLAACIGNSFNLATLAIISEQSPIETAAALWKALQSGLIVPIGDVYKFYVGQESLAITQENQETVTYKFIHDRVQQAAYSLIPDDQKTATHFKIGQLLLENLSELELEEKLFDIVGHLNLGIELISQSREREALAKLNLQAGVKARNSTAYAAARVYLQTGIKLLQTNCWQHQYELTLNLYVTGAEVAYLNGDLEGMEQQAALVLQQAQTIFDKVKIYEIQIAAQMAQSQVLEAIAIGRDALSQLEVDLPSTPDEAQIGKVLEDLASLEGSNNPSALVNLPKMSDRTAQAAMQLLGVLFAPMLLGMPGLLPLLSATMVRLSLQFGNAPASTAGYGLHGMILCAFLGEVETGYEFGKLALLLLEGLNAQSMKSVTLNLFGSFIQHHQQGLLATLPTLKDGYTTGIETGDFLYAGYNIAGYACNGLFAGVEVEALSSELTAYNAVLAQMKQESAHIYSDMVLQTLEHLRETVSQPDCLMGSVYDETVMLPKHHQDNDFTAIAIVYTYKLLLAYYFGNYQAALDYIIQGKSYLMAVSGMFFIPIFHFYAALTHLALFPSQKDAEQAKLLAVAVTHQTALHQLAQNAPMNHLHKWYLVEAERHRVLGEKAAASECYDQAISLAKEHQFIHEEALANELAAKFYLEWGKQRIAKEYLAEAYYGYARWGAKAKVADLEKRYPQLLAAILQQTRAALSVNETVFALGSVTSNSSTSSSSSVSDSLDLKAILKASQTISGEIELEKLLLSLLSIAIENAGADKCVFMLMLDNRLLIKGSITGELQPVVLQRIPIEDSQDIPHKLIYKVLHNQQTIVLLDATADPTLANDPYIIRQQPKSILCSPILRQGKLLGILYLENNLATGAFSGDRVELLNLLCAQAAISLENARLYERSLEYAHQLERLFDEFSAAQSTLQASQQRLQLLVQQTPLAAIEWDINFQVTDWNPAAERIFGYTKQEALGCDFRFIIPQSIQAQMQRVSVDIISQQGGNYSINENVTKDGKTIFCAWYNNPLVSADGELIGVASLADDITDRQAAEIQLQQKAQELETALQNLQQAQLQMIQSEKMSALGNLVASVAHEMNNPLGFISVSLKQIKPTIADIVEHLKLYQETLPNKSEEIIDHAESIDLEYSLSDLHEVINSMTMACDRLKNISTSLRTFSRADKDYKVQFKIHEGIDSTILILKHRLKANELRPAIEVVTNYGNLTLIKCFPGQINQVFMNILANAIDALDESNIGRSFEDIKVNPNRITITTSMADKLMKIAIADNGKGISEEIKQKIFDHLFTTKAVGKGTGLGLAIAQQIVESTHGGKLICNSIIGEGTEFIIEIPV